LPTVLRKEERSNDTATFSNFQVRKVPTSLEQEVPTPNEDRMQTHREKSAYD
jgi:hypothetical protein